MSKKQLIKDNVLMFVGGNIANALNYLLNIILLRTDKPLFNLFTAYSSLTLLLFIPSLVSLRVFTVFGNPVIANLRESLIRNKNKYLIGIIVLVSLLIPLNLLLTNISEDGNFITSSLLLIVATISILANIVRGIQQYEENYKRAILSINIEALGRLFLGFFFAVILKFGISGILIGHIIGLIGSLLVCFEKKHIAITQKKSDQFRLKNIFYNTFIMTAGLEFLSNFDIVYSNRILQKDVAAQTEYNVLQFFRKIIFFGIYTVSSTILSIGSKDRHSKKFMFLFTFMTGLIIGIGCGIGFFLLKGLIFKLLAQDISLISNQELAIFICATTLMSTGYLLSNWLFSLKRKLYIYIPLISSGIQFIIFVLSGHSLQALLNAFYISSIMFFLLAVAGSVLEITNTQHNNIR